MGLFFALSKSIITTNVIIMMLVVIVVIMIIIISIIIVITTTGNNRYCYQNLYPIIIIITDITAYFAYGHVLCVR